MPEILFACVKCQAVYPREERWCVSCGAFDAVFPVYQRNADALWRGGPREASAAQLVGRRPALFESSSYPSLKIGPRAVVAIWGAPGAGKSSMLCKYLDGTEAPLLLSMEEGLGDTLSARLKRLEIHSEAFRVAVADTIEEIADLVERHRPSCLGLDSLSVTTLKVGDVLRLSEAVAVPVLFTLHATKAGGAAGEAGILHAVDVVVEVSAMRWRISKSRFTGNLEGEV